MRTVLLLPIREELRGHALISWRGLPKPNGLSGSRCLILFWQGGSEESDCFRRHLEIMFNDDEFAYEETRRKGAKDGTLLMFRG